MRRILTLVILALAVTNLTAQSNNQIFEFEFEGFVLNGVLNLPKDTKPKGIVLIVHGSGQTNAVGKRIFKLEAKVLPQPPPAGDSTHSKLLEKLFRVGKNSKNYQ